MSELLALMYVGNVYLDDRRLDAADTVVQCNAGVCVSTGVEHDAVAREALLLHLVDEHALYVTLEIVYLDVRIALAQLRQEIVEGRLAVDARLTTT